MNKKKNPDLVRTIAYLIRLNKAENEMFQKRLIEAFDMKPIEFVRDLMIKGKVVVPPKKEELVSNEKLISILIEYRTNFNRLSNLIKFHDPALNHEIAHLVKSIQNLIDGV